MFAAVPTPHWLDRCLAWLAGHAPPDTFFGELIPLRAFVALLLVGLACGAVGSLVVGGRMAFFSDALAHVSFASVSVGFVFFTLVLTNRPDEEFWDWVTPVMVGFGMLTGYGIAAVRRQTNLASDTVIGVFFASALGLAATLRGIINSRKLFHLEGFLFGDPVSVRAEDVVLLAAQVVVVSVVLAMIYNSLLLSGFNPSLALSRRVPVRLASYAFVMLLAVVVTLCARTVGVLLINALLVVPAAAACNVTRNLRQLFWLTMGLCLLACVAGQWVAWEAWARGGVRLETSGVVVLACVLLFVLSLAARSARDRLEVWSSRRKSARREETP